MRRLLRATFAVAIAASAAAAAAETGPAAPLIERTKLLGNQTRTSGRVSPDGRWLAWVAPREGVMNVWIAPIGDPAAARPLTAERRPLRSYRWAPDSRSILFVSDSDGDENYKVYGVDIASGRRVALTPFDKTQARILASSPAVPGRILVGINHRDPKWHDVYRIDLKTGEASLVFENRQGFASFVADRRLNLRRGLKPREDGGKEVYEIRGSAAGDRPVEVIPAEDAQSTEIVGFSDDGRTLYWLDSRGRNTAALVAQDLRTGSRRVLGQDPRADVTEVLAHPRTGAPQGFVVSYLKAEWTPIDTDLAQDLAFLKSRLSGQLSIISRSADGSVWTLAHDPVSEAPSTWLYQRDGRRLTKLFTGRETLIGAPLQPMHGVEIKTRDGHVQVAFLTLPPGSDRDGDGRPEAPVPMVLLVHGGPWARDGYGFTPQHQWLANRGYAVLSPNFRSSTGYGKAWINAGDREWGGRMQDDLLDAVDWAVAHGVAQRDRVAIMGESYGGYATLVGLSSTPETFACGVDLVGPSNLESLLASLPPYFQALRAQFDRRIGDSSTEEGRAFLRARSPLFKAGAIKRPLLISHGSNDPRVKQAESEQIARALAEKGLPVTLLVFPDEGHEFSKAANRVAFHAAAEHFLQACLGGRAEPYGEALKASTITAPLGAAFTPGLAAALQARGGGR